MEQKWVIIWDWATIVLCIVAFLACIYTMGSIGSYQERVNAAWVKQWEASGCKKSYIEPNITFNLAEVTPNEVPSGG